MCVSLSMCAPVSPCVNLPVSKPQTPVFLSVSVSQLVSSMCAPELSAYDLLLDAVFGFSFRGPPRPPYSLLLQQVASSGLPVFSVDVPSGWDVDGSELGCPLCLSGVSRDLSCCCLQLSRRLLLALKPPSLLDALVSRGFRVKGLQGLGFRVWILQAAAVVLL